jgi:hypothetical protein
MIRFLEEKFEVEYAVTLFWVLGTINVVASPWYPNLVWTAIYWHLCGVVFFFFRKKTKTKPCSSCYGTGICLACNGAGKVVI